MTAKKKGPAVPHRATRGRRAIPLSDVERDKRLCIECGMMISKIGWAQCYEQECQRHWDLLKKKEGGAA